MHTDHDILRAVLRMSRNRRHVDLASLSLRVAGDDGDLRAALRRLETSGLIVRSADVVRLTMPGLAVAVALLPSRAKASPVRRAIRRAA